MTTDLPLHFDFRTQNWKCTQKFLKILGNPFQKLKENMIIRGHVPGVLYTLKPRMLQDTKLVYVYPLASYKREIDKVRKSNQGLWGLTCRRRKRRSIEHVVFSLSSPHVVAWSKHTRYWRISSRQLSSILAQLLCNCIVTLCFSANLLSKLPRSFLDVAVEYKFILIQLRGNASSSFCRVSWNFLVKNWNFFHPSIFSWYHTQLFCIFYISNSNLRQ